MNEKEKRKNKEHNRKERIINVPGGENMTDVGEIRYIRKKPHILKEEEMDISI